MTTLKQHFFFLILVKLVDKNHVVILLDEKSLTDIDVHISSLFKLIDLRDCFRTSFVEHFRSPGELLK